VSYADDFLLLAKKELVLQGIVNTLNEIGRCYGIGMNMEINLAKISLKTNIPTEDTINKNNCRIWTFKIFD